MPFLINIEKCKSGELTFGDIFMCPMVTVSEQLVSSVVRFVAAIDWTFEWSFLRKVTQVMICSISDSTESGFTIFKLADIWSLLGVLSPVDIHVAFVLGGVGTNVTSGLVKDPSTDEFVLMGLIFE